MHEAFEAPGRFWRGNLHGHSTGSDGALAPLEVCARYRAAGYDFVAVSDHFMARFDYPVTDTRGARQDGFTTLLAVVAPNLLCKPATILYNKVTIKDARQAVQMFGPAQYAVAKAVADSVAEGVIPADEADDLYVCVGVFIHWEAADDKKIQDFNYQATKEAIARAVAGEPTAAQVTAQKDSAAHPFAAG